MNKLCNVRDKKFSMFHNVFLRMQHHNLVKIIIQYFLEIKKARSIIINPKMFHRVMPLQIVWFQFLMEGIFHTLQVVLGPCLNINISLVAKMTKYTHIWIPQILQAIVYHVLELFQLLVMEFTNVYQILRGHFYEPLINVGELNPSACGVLTQ